MSTDWFNRDGQPIDVMTANSLLGDPDYKRVGLTRVTSSIDPGVNYLISTVWLGLNHSHTGGLDLFETMVFSSDDNLAEELCQRYGTEEQAATGHREIVATVAATIPDDQVRDLDAWPT